MNELKFFENDAFGEIRIIETNDGNVMFCGTDIARALGYTNPQKAIRDHCKTDGVTNRSVIDSIGRQQEAKFISEGNVYRLITHSKLPNAEKFEKWVFEEVLPSIRKNGFYGTDQFLECSINNPEYAIEMLKAYKQERDNRKMLEHKVVRLETKIENDAPMVEFAKALADSDELLTVGEFACIVNQALAVSFTDVSVGRNQMFEILRENGHLLSQKSMRNAPSSFMSKNDYMRIVKVYSDRDRRYNPETRITHSGAMYLFKSLRNQVRKESKRDSFRRMF